MIIYHLSLLAKAKQNKQSKGMNDKVIAKMVDWALFSYFFGVVLKHNWPIQMQNHRHKWVGQSATSSVKKSYLSKYHDYGWRVESMCCAKEEGLGGGFLGTILFQNFKDFLRKPFLVKTQESSWMTSKKSSERLNNRFSKIF